MSGPLFSGDWRQQNANSGALPTSNQFMGIAQQYYPNVSLNGPNSGYRTPDMNAALGGSSDSRHMMPGGHAVDTSGASPAALGALLRQMDVPGVRSVFETANDPNSTGDHGHTQWGPGYSGPSSGPQTAWISPPYGSLNAASQSPQRMSSDMLRPSVTVMGEGPDNSSFNSPGTLASRTDQGSPSPSLQAGPIGSLPVDTGNLPSLNFQSPSASNPSLAGQMLRGDTSQNSSPGAFNFMGPSPPIQDRLGSLAAGMAIPGGGFLFDAANAAGAFGGASDPFGTGPNQVNSQAPSSDGLFARAMDAGTRLGDSIGSSPSVPQDPNSAQASNMGGNPSSQTGNGAWQGPQLGQLPSLNFGTQPGQSVGSFAQSSPQWNLGMVGGGGSWMGQSMRPAYQ